MQVRRLAVQQHRVHAVEPLHSTHYCPPARVMGTKFWFVDIAEHRLPCPGHPGLYPPNPLVDNRGKTHLFSEVHVSKETRPWLKPSSSRQCVHRSGSATADCPGYTRRISPRRCSTAWSTGPASTRASSTTSSGAASCRPGNRPSTSAAPRC